MTTAPGERLSPEVTALAGSRVLVTGASGFIGSRLCPLLTRSGAEVHGFSRGILVQTTGVSRWWRGDVSNEQDVRVVLQDSRPDFVFHLAGHVSGLRSRQKVEPTFHTNALGALNMLNHCADQGVRRLVLAGSLEEPDVGATATVSVSPYAASKATASIYARMFHVLYETPVVVARLFMVYGPGQRDLTKLIPYVALSLLRGETPALSSGLRPVDWLFVDDAAEALVSLLLPVGLEGSTIDVGSGTVRTVRDVVENVAALIAPPVSLTFGTIPDRPREVVRVADAGNTYELTGWRAATPMDRVLSLTVDWYRANASHFSSLPVPFSKESPDVTLKESS